MRKLNKLFIIAVISLCFAASASAQTARFGIKGGVNLSQIKLENIAAAGLSESYVGFNAGIALNLKLGLGFYLQPELIYSRTCMEFGLIENNIPTVGDIKVPVSHSIIELPVNIQWGMRFGPVRIYIQASPYVGYSLSDGITIGGGVQNVLDIDKLQYGVGAGGGIDIWKFQISYRYKWDMNPLDRNTTIQDLEVGAAKIRSSEISLAFFF